MPTAESRAGAFNSGGPEDSLGFDMGVGGIDEELFTAFGVAREGEMGDVEADRAAAGAD